MAIDEDVSSVLSVLDATWSAAPGLAKRKRRALPELSNDATLGAAPGLAKRKRQQLIEFTD